MEIVRRGLGAGGGGGGGEWGEEEGKGDRDRKIDRTGQTNPDLMQDG